MASVSIRERILRQIRTDVAAISGIGTVYRWDGRSLIAWANLDGVVLSGEEKASEAIGNPGTIRCVLNVSVSVLIFPDESATTRTDQIVADWATKLRDKLLDNRLMVETTSAVRLAVNSTIADSDAIDIDPGATAATIRISVTYDHDGDSPYALGTAIALLTE